MNSHYLNLGRGESIPYVVVLEMMYQFIKNYNYLVVDPLSRQAVIIDPAWQMEKVDQALNDSQASLSGILITHSHPDHIHLAKALATKYDCPIWMSKTEIAVSGFNAPQLIGIDETPWFVGKMLIQPISTPGHTAGCICYRIGDNLFTGDVLFAEGCGICPDVEAAHAMFTSLEHLKTGLKPQTRIFPGHSYGKLPGQLFSQLLQDNIYLQFTDKHSFARFRLRSGQNKAKMFNFS
ncbi:MAG: MBL fold metallo-hydrolase [Pseudomonadota bacterium]